MSGRPFLPEEDQFIRTYYRAEGCDVVAAVLQRSRSSIYQRANKLGIVERMNIVSDEQIIATLRDLHPQGYTDAEVTRWLVEHTGIRVNRHRVGIIRRSINLPPNNLSDHRRQQVAAKTREQLQQAGLKSLADLRTSRFKQWKRSLGWPETLTVRATQAAELFYRRGPMTRLQLCAAMGIDKKKRLARTEPKSNAKGGTVLAELAAHGLILRLRKAVPSGRDRRGGVRTVDLYMLQAGVTKNVQTPTAS